MSKPWSKMTADEKAEWLKAELQQMSSLYAMLASQIQEIGRAVKTLEKRPPERQQPERQ